MRSLAPSHRAHAVVTRSLASRVYCNGSAADGVRISVISSAGSAIQLRRRSWLWGMAVGAAVTYPATSSCAWRPQHADYPDSFRRRTKEESGTGGAAVRTDRVPYALRRKSRSDPPRSRAQWWRLRDHVLGGGQHRALDASAGGGGGGATLRLSVPRPAKLCPQWRRGACLGCVCSLPWQRAPVGRC